MLIYVVRFVTWSVWGVFYAFLAVWLRGTDLFAASEIGVIASTAIVASRIGGLVFAPLVERYHKRRVVQAAMAAAALSVAVMYALAHGRDSSLPLWMCAAAVFGMANAAATLAQVTFIARQFDPEERRTAYSRENVALNLGASTAPFVSAVLVAHATRWFALAPLVPALLGLLLASGLPADRPRPSGAESAGSGAGATGFGVSERRAVTVILALNFLTFVAYAQFYDLFPAYATHSLGSEAVGLTFVVGNGAIAAMQLLVTKLSDGWSETTQVTLSNLVMAVGVVMLIAARDELAVAFLAVFVMTAAEMVYGPLYQVIAVRAFGGRETWAMSIITLMWGLAESAATVVGIVLIGEGRGAVSIAIGAGACLLAAALAAWAGRTAGRSRTSGDRAGADAPGPPSDPIPAAPLPAARSADRSARRRVRAVPSRQRPGT
jgi:predicted MFS family arabinose efflux permease